MRKKTSIVSILSLLLISGCAFTPSSPEGMRNNGTFVKTFCSQAAADETAKRIADGWKRCYFIGPTASGQQAVVVGGVPMLVPTRAGSGDYLDVTTSGHRITVAKGNIGAGNVQMMADIEPTASCPAQVTIRGGNFAWSGKAATAEVFSAKPDTSCKEL
ncbi:MAG: hypothetical protein ACK4S6_07385 [Roseateles asaccharophilus]|uniref:hypothetical protein n=1 Tax=Roseateles asaccharophilus TaxID=582607 RepID=UPI00105B6008|nr:hypothetical protein [Roseateles asaccharophilus]MDN3543562.1 hypothetical protein [Roseateles asaccharophilus]